MSDASRLPALGLIAELWYDRVPALTDPAVVAALREVSAATEAQEESITVPHPLADPELPPLLTVVVPGSPLGQDGKRLPDVSQTWDWAGAEEAVRRCSSSLLVTEMLTAGRTPIERLASLGRVVEALVAATAPAAIHWARSQRVSNPAAFGAQDLDGVINVRMVSDPRDDDALAMDTLGLYVFDLPDVQCCFVGAGSHVGGLEPGGIAELLFTTAVYLFEHGDVIEDGNTISGTDGEGRYRCHREASLLDPARLVLDVDLGEPYAAGRREMNR